MERRKEEERSITWIVPEEKNPFGIGVRLRRPGKEEGSPFTVRRRNVSSG